MSTLDKIMGWIRRYWYVLVIGASGLAVLVASIFFRGKSKAVIDALSKNRKGYIEQVKKIDEIHEKASQKKEEALETHKAEVIKIGQKHNVKVREIDLSRIETEKELSNKSSTELADQLKKSFDL